MRSYIKNLPETFLNREEDEAIYPNLLQELEKIQSKISTSKQESIYKVSPEMQDFFEMIGECRDQIFSLLQFKAAEIPILQPIFNKEEVAGVKEFLQELEKEEEVFLEKIMEVLIEHKLELQEEEREPEAKVSQQTKKGKTGKTNKSVQQENPAATAISITSKNWPKKN